MRDSFTIHSIPKRPLVKKCLDVLPVNIGRRIVHVSPLMVSSVIVVGKDNKYLSDRLATLYYAMTKDKTVQHIKCSTGKEKYITIDHRGVVLSVGDGILRIADCISLKERREYISVSSVVARYIFKILFSDSSYTYPLALVNRKTNVCTIAESNKYMTYLYLRTEIDMIQMSISSDAMLAIKDLSILGERIERYRRELHLNFIDVSRLMAITQFVMSMDEDIDITPNVVMYVYNRTIKDTSRSSVWNEYIRMVRIIMKYLKRYKDIIQMDKR